MIVSPSFWIKDLGGWVLGGPRMGWMSFFVFRFFFIEFCFWFRILFFLNNIFFGISISFYMLERGRWFVSLGLHRGLNLFWVANKYFLTSVIIKWLFPLKNSIWLKINWSQTVIVDTCLINDLCIHFCIFNAISSLSSSIKSNLILPIRQPSCTKKCKFILSSIEHMSTNIREIIQQAVSSMFCIKLTTITWHLVDHTWQRGSSNELLTT